MNQNDKAGTCLVCGQNLSTSNRYPGLNNCLNCEFLTADLKISDLELENLYGPDYFHDGEYVDYIAEKTALQLNFKRRLEYIRSLPSVGKQSKIFEIGCAYGFFLELLKGHFSVSAGIDIAEDATKYAREKLEVEAHYGNFLQFQPNFRPDVVCLWDVIEHIKNPREVIEHTSQISAPKGYILITTGDVSSFNARLRGPKWRLIHPPTHLHYFSRKSIRTLLVNAGYENVEFSYPPIWRTVDSIIHAIIDQWSGFKFFKNLLENIPGSGIAIPLNLFDVMLVTAKKKK